MDIIIDCRTCIEPHSGCVISARPHEHVIKSIRITSLNIDADVVDRQELDTVEIIVGRKPRRSVHDQGDTVSYSGVVRAKVHESVRSRVSRTSSRGASGDIKSYG